MKNKKEIELLKEKVDQFIPDWQDDATHLAGWLHHYFCDDDGIRLTFDRKNPNAHVCPGCGRVYHDENRRNAWVCLFRDETFVTMCDAAVIYKATGESRYLAFVKQIFEFYGRAYVDFPPHIWNDLVDYTVYREVHAEFLAKLSQTPEFVPERAGDSHVSMDERVHVVGPGKILSQGLDDAIVLIYFAVVFQLLADDFSVTEKEWLIETFFVPAKDYLEAQQFYIHNITLWKEVAIQILNLVTHHEADVSLERPVGILDHLTIGTTADAWWFEGSFHYHLYAAESVSYLAYMLSVYQIEAVELKQALYKMLKFASDVAFENGDLPCPNDGWPNITLLTYLKVFELAKMAYPTDPDFDAIYQHVLALVGNQAIDVFDKHFLSFLFLDSKALAPRPVQQTGLKKYTDSQVSTLTNSQFKLFVKWGINTKSHAHFDPLTYELSVGKRHLMRDISNSGYGSALNSAWYNTTFSHNTVILNQATQNHIFYETQVLSEREDYLACQSQTIYGQGETISRTYQLKDDEVIIRTSASGRASDCFAIGQHFDVDWSELLVVGAFETCQAADLFGTHDTKDFVRKIQRTTEKCQAVMFKLDDLTLTLTANQPVDFYLVATVGNPSTTERVSVYVVGTGTVDSSLTIQC